MRKHKLQLNYKIQKLLLIVLGIVTITLGFSLKSYAANQSNDWRWPTHIHTLKNDWPKYSSGKYHSGTDFPVPLNTPVYATCDGKIVSVRSLTNSYGKHIKMESVVNGSKVYIRYCHLNSFKVSVGDKVSAGQLIAYSGSTGNSTGPHLHYEVRNSTDTYGDVNHPTLNPRNYLPGTSNKFTTNNGGNSSVSPSTGKDFLFEVDFPANESTHSGDIRTQLWTLYKYGGVSEIVCVLNGTPIMNCDRYTRTDVSNTFPGYPTGNEGACGTINKNLLRPGKNELFFRAFGNDNTLLISEFGHRTINYIPPKEPKWHIDSLPLNLTTTGKVTGWFVSDASIVKVGVTLNNIEQEAALSERPDLKAHFPEYDISKAGFSYELNATQVKNGENSLIIKAYTSDSQCTELYKGTFHAIKMDEDMFNMEYYYGKYSASDPIVQSIGMDYTGLLNDYFSRTLALGYSPSMSFDPIFYLEEPDNSDLKQAFDIDYISAYSHFVEFVLHGTEFRKVSSFLDLWYYKTTYTDLSNMNTAQLLQHYNTYGSKECRLAADNNFAMAWHEMYNPKEYAKNHEDLLNAFGNGSTEESRQGLLDHFWLRCYACNEHRSTSDKFDIYYVITKYNFQNTIEAFQWYTTEGYIKGYETEGHKTLHKTDAVAPSCTTEGTNAYYTCTICSRIFSDNEAKNETSITEIKIPAAGHTETTIPAIPATTEQTGLTEGIHCNICGIVLKEQKIIPKLLTDSNNPEDNEQEEDGTEDKKPEDSEHNKEPEKISHTVRFQSNGIVLETQTVADGEQALEPEEPTRKGYRFAGWYKGKKLYDFDQEIVIDLTLTAKWKKVTVNKVTLKSLSKILTPKSKKIHISYKKIIGADGYKIQVSEKKYFPAKKTITKITTKTKCQISNLKKKTKYYIRVKAYKSDSTGKNIYGKWSNLKKIK